MAGPDTHGWSKVQHAVDAGACSCAEAALRGAHRLTREVDAHQDGVGSCGEAIWGCGWCVEAGVCRVEDVVGVGGGLTAAVAARGAVDCWKVVLCCGPYATLPAGG